ncbi:DISARM system phospholipase D-like protein DrmC [Micromonospora sp. WMMD730]|uniref:DISARM system phospholipase D-like protein DrmC n=1 Tax=Micromonospora sp. WMMD730 TaxID=3404128 RepID=UPI003B954CE7
MSHERFAALIADLTTMLPADHLDVWADVLVNVDAPGDGAMVAELADARPGFSVGTHAERLIRSWRTEAPDLSGAAVALALRSSALLQRRTEARRTELAVSGPTTVAGPVRLTSSVVVEVIRGARSRLLVASFAAYGIAEVINELLSAAQRGVHIDLILESSTEDGGALRGSGAAATFAALRHQATFWHWPAARRAASGNPRAALHAKLIAADDEVAVISSANLTDRALSHNIEVGVVLHDPAVVRRLVAHFRALTDPRTGVLKRLL